VNVGEALLCQLPRKVVLVSIKQDFLSLKDWGTGCRWHGCIGEVQRWAIKSAILW